jgi:exopolyphosphatase
MLTEFIGDRRDWKGDVVLDSTLPIHLGFASIPYSFQQLIEKTPNKTIENFWEIEDDWAHHNQVDIAIMLTSYKNEEGEKRREIIMTVKSHHRIDANEAERLFNDAKRDIEASEDLKLTPWNNGQELPQWRYAWTHNREDGGRKIVRPLVEKAVQHW